MEGGSEEASSNPNAAAVGPAQQQADVSSSPPPSPPDENELVLSEVHMERPGPGIAEDVTTTYEFRLTQRSTQAGHFSSTSRSRPLDQVDDITVDEDGDLVVARRKPSTFRSRDEAVNPMLTVSISHAMATSLSRVGLQVWRGALLLCDYLIHSRCSQWLDEDERFPVCIELGAGTGLVSVVAAMLGFERVYCTDTGDNVLDNAAANVAINDVDRRVSVRELNWLHAAGQLEENHGDADINVSTGDASTLASNMKCSSSSQQKHGWTARDKDVLWSRLGVIFAADVIYDDALTDAFVATVRLLLSRTEVPHATCLVAAEKRFNFTLDEARVSCPHFEYFQRICLDNRRDFVCERIDTSSFPQHCDYDRTSDIELWSVRLRN